MAGLTTIASAVEIDIASRCRQSLRSEAWDELWHRYRKLAGWEIQRVLPGTREDIIEDLVIETYRRLVLSMDLFNPRRGKLSTFVVQVARSTALDHRKKQRRRPLEDGADGATPDPSATAREAVPLDFMLRRVVQSIPSPEREDERLVLGAILEGLSNVEIVAKFGITEKIVRRVRRETLEKALDILNEILPGS